MTETELLDGKLACPRCGARGIVRDGLCRACGALVQDFADDEAMLRRSEIFSDKYRVVGLLGTGTFGEVYRVEHLMLRREMALKVLRPELGTDPDIAERFLREIHVAMDFVHQGAVAIREAGKADGLLYYTMDLCRGATLERVVREDGPLHVGRLVHLADPFLGCLAEAHRQGILHRDLKPANLMVERDAGTERIHVIDFGVARIFQDVESHRTTGGAMGSPSYMAPEVIRGEDHGPAADQYAAACVLYFAATGFPPHEGETSREIILAHLEKEPRPPSAIRRELPEALDSVLLHALAKRPEDRHADVEALRSALRSILREAPTVSIGGRMDDLPRVEARIASAPGASGSHDAALPSALPVVSRRAAPTRSSGTPAWALMVALVFVCGAIFGAAWFARLERRRADEERIVPPVAGLAGVLGGDSGTGPNANDSERGAARTEPAVGVVEASASDDDDAAREPVLATIPLGIHVDPRCLEPVRLHAIHLEGRVDGVDEARLVVDGQEDLVRAGAFKTRVELPKVGANVVSLAVQSSDGRRGETTVTCIVDPDPPELVIDAPSETLHRTNAATVTITGRASDPFLAEVRVDERPVHVDSEGRFTHVVPIPSGSSTIHVVALDRAGNASERVLAVQRDRETVLFESIQPADGSSSRAKEILVIFRTFSDVRSARIDGRDAFVQPSGREVQGSAMLRQVGENAIAVEAVDGQGRRHQTTLHVRYWPYPDWMWIEDPQALTLDAETGLPWRVRRRSDGAEMVLVKAGEFLLGNGNPLAREPREKPARRVILTANYYMDRYELSNRMYARFARETKHAPPAWWKDGNVPDEALELPAVGISWDDAMDYARWAEVSLPTEAQWEFAAKGNSSAPYPWGETLHQQRANFDVGGQPRVAGQFLANLLPVTEFETGASAWGVLQMSGNAWEWCLDGYREDAYSQWHDYERDPLTPPTIGERRTVRGGCWFSLRRYVTTTYRTGLPRDHVDPSRDSVTARFVRVLGPADYPPVK